ncbi:MAG: hypothetical protein GF401_16275 [Chitinivibrionales bacterium]|nr:hypothetical protein [Chitinivibrionales bacterium]
MTRNMTLFGAGHKIAALAFPGIALSLLIGFLFRDVFRFGTIPAPVLVGSGIGLMVVGLSVNFFSAFSMMRAFKEHRLLTSGPYGLSRNPMYASFIFLTIPGLSLALNCWAVLAASVALYAATARFAKVEEEWLAARFGTEWDAYAHQVGRIFPKVW